MNNNVWFKLTIVSLVGIVVSVAAIGLVFKAVNLGNNSAHYQYQPQVQQYQNTMSGMNGMNGMNNMPMQGGANMYMPVSNMQPQGNMNMQQVNPGNMQADYNYMMMMQQLNQMQQQLNTMQQNGGMSGGSGGMSGGMGMM